MSSIVTCLLCCAEPFDCSVVVQVFVCVVLTPYISKRMTNFVLPVNLSMVRLFLVCTYFFAAGLFAFIYTCLLFVSQFFFSWLVPPAGGAQPRWCGGRASVRI